LPDEKPKRTIVQSVRAVVIGVVLCLAAIGVTICLVVYVMVAVDQWRGVQALASSENELTPRPLTDLRIAELHGQRLVGFGISLQLPWNEIDQTRNYKSAQATTYKDGGRVVIFNDDQDVTLRNVLQPLTQGRTKPWTDLIGPDGLASNYNFAAASLRIKPSDARWWTPTKNRKILALLMEKMLILRSSDTAIYDIKQGEFRGFQAVSPDTASHGIMLSLYDGKDRSYRILLAPTKDAAHSPLTQPEINAIVASMRPTRP
jgi:hypothetical protein